jgi:Flp pilus assembly protein CpaB
MTYQFRNFAVAAALAALAGLLTVVYVNSSKREQKQKATPVTVLVAARDIAPGTKGSDLVRKHYVKTVSVAYGQAATGAVRQPDALATLVVQQQIYKGEQITTRRFTTPDAQGLRGQVTGRYRVVELPGDSHQVLAGTLEAGDRVDVLGSWLQPEGSQHHVTGTIVRGVRVLAASTGGSDGLASSSGGGSVKVALTDQQAQRVFWLTRNGDWTLELRPATGGRDSKPSLDSSRTLQGKR